MRAEFYLVVEGVRSRYRPPELPPTFELGRIRTTKRKPERLSRDEVALKITLELPDTLFYKPTLEARVTVPDSLGEAPPVTAEVAHHVAEAVREHAGIVLHIDGPEVES